MVDKLWSVKRPPPLALRAHEAIGREAAHVRHPVREGEVTLRRIVPVHSQLNVWPRRKEALVEQLPDRVLHWRRALQHLASARPASFRRSSSLTSSSNSARVESAIRIEPIRSNIHVSSWHTAQAADQPVDRNQSLLLRHDGDRLYFEQELGTCECGDEQD